MSIKNELLLTKTLLMKGFQCPKHLYLHLNHPELAVDESFDKAKAEGLDIGLFAHKLYPKGILVESKRPELALIETENKKEMSVLFEPAFKYENMFFRADIIESTECGLNVIEVKSSSEVKNHHLQDLGIQAYILSKLKVKVNKYLICHVNNGFTWESDPIDFFKMEDVTERIENILPEVEKKIIQLQDFVSNFSEVKIGSHCNKPYECPFKSHCFSQNKIEKTSVINFPSLNLRWDFHHSGKKTVFDLNDSDLKTENQKKYLRLFKSGSPHFEIEKIKEILESWEKPIYFLDFETFDYVFPRYAKTKPNTKIPYQYSVFTIKDKPHLVSSYLTNTIDSDPRLELAPKLIDSLKDAKTVVCYNASFEKARINEMAELLPERAKDLLAISSKIVDLLDVMKNYVFYREFYGSWSLKSVVPAIFGAEESYGNMVVKNGLDSQKIFLESIKEDKLEEVKSDLIDYCNKDVIEMVNLFLFLEYKIKNT